MVFYSLLLSGKRNFIDLLVNMNLSYAWLLEAENSEKGNILLSLRNLKAWRQITLICLKIRQFTAFLHSKIENDYLFFFFECN